MTQRMTSSLPAVDNTPLAILLDEPEINLTISEDPGEACIQLNAELVQSLQYALRHTITESSQKPSIYGVPTGVMMRFGHAVVYHCPSLADIVLEADPCRFHTKLFFKLMEECALHHVNDDEIWGYPLGLEVKCISTISMEGQQAEFLVMQLNPLLFGDGARLEVLPVFKPLADRFSMGNLVANHVEFESNFPAVMDEVKKLQSINLDSARAPINWLEFWR